MCSQLVTVEVRESRMRPAGQCSVRHPEVMASKLTQLEPTQSLAARKGRRRATYVDTVWRDRGASNTIQRSRP